MLSIPEMPPDLADAFDSMRLAILRNRQDGWREISKANCLTVLGMLCQVVVYYEETEADYRRLLDAARGENAKA